MVVLLCTPGCSPPGAHGGDSLLLYCTPSAKRYAAELARTAEAACGRAVILAPLRRHDLLTAVSGTRAGDFVLTLDASLGADLAGLGLAGRVQELGNLSLCAVTAGGESLKDLCEPGVRLGSGSPKGVLGRACAAALPSPLREAVDVNARHRSERCDELVRLIRLGALDAAVVWETPSLPEGLRSLAIPGTASAGRLYAIRLTCSRHTPERLSRVGDAWSGDAGRTALRGLGVRAAAGGDGT